MVHLLCNLMTSECVVDGSESQTSPRNATEETERKGFDKSSPEEDWVFWRVGQYRSNHIVCLTPLKLLRLSHFNFGTPKS